MIKNERGSTLALCVIIMSMLSVFVVGMYGILITNRKQKLNELSYEKSFYLIDSCIAATQRELQNRVSIVMTNTLAQIGFDDVPVVYTDDEGNTQVYPADDFKDLFTDYVMRKFTTKAIREQLLLNYVPANPSNPLDYTKAKDAYGNLTESDILGATLNSSLIGLSEAEGGDSSVDPLWKYNIKTEIEYDDNMAFDDFSKRYRKSLSTGRKDYLASLGLGLSFSADEYEGWSSDDEKNFDNGHATITYTITHPDPSKTENIRVQYTFDLYSQLEEICEKHAALIYSAGTAGIDPENPENPSTPSSGSLEATYSISLNTKVVREYLAD